MPPAGGGGSGHAVPAASKGAWIEEVGHRSNSSSGAGGDGEGGEGSTVDSVISSDSAKDSRPGTADEKAACPWQFPVDQLMPDRKLKGVWAISGISPPCIPSAPPSGCISHLRVPVELPNSQLGATFTFAYLYLPVRLHAVLLPTDTTNVIFGGETSDDWRSEVLTFGACDGGQLRLRRDEVRNFKAPIHMHAAS